MMHATTTTTDATTTTTTITTALTTERTKASVFAVFAATSAIVFTTFTEIFRVFNHPTRLIHLGSAVCLVACLTGCQLFQGADQDSGIQVPDEAPSYAQLAQSYNENLASVPQLWSRSVVAMRWIDEDGKRRYEQAEGNFIFRGERDLALRIAKLDEVIFWFGSNQTHYWLIDRYGKPSTTTIIQHPTGSIDSTPNTASSTQQSQDASHADQYALPTTLPVAELIKLAALQQIDPEKGTSRIQDGLFVIEPVGSNVRLYLDPLSLRPVKSELFKTPFTGLENDLTNSSETALANCMMSAYEPVEVPNQSELNWPVIATRYVITSQQQDGSLTLSLDSTSMTTSDRRVRDGQFDLNYLMTIFPTEKTVGSSQ